MNRIILLMVIFILILSSLTIVRLEHSQSAVAEVTYSGVAFRETGLPNGTVWTVNCNGTQYQSANPYISISLPMGNYTFYVPDISGYTVFPQNGTVTAILDPIKLTDITFSLGSPSPTPTPIPTASPSPTPIPSESPSTSPLLSPTPSPSPSITPSPSIPEVPSSIIWSTLFALAILVVLLKTNKSKPKSRRIFCKTFFYKRRCNNICFIIKKWKCG